MPTTNFPTALDNGTSLPNPSSNSNTVTLSHAGQHDVANDAIKALEAKMGIGASTPSNGQFFVGTGTGSSAWANPSVGGDLTGTLPNPTLAASGVSAGTYAKAKITVDSKGRVTTAIAGVVITPFTSQTSISVNHNLGYKPAVVVVDSAGDVCEGTVHHTDDNNLTVSFSASFSGTIICN